MRPAATSIQRAFKFAGSVSAERRVGTPRLLFFADLREEEVARRLHGGIGAIVDRGVINALWELPEELEFPRESVPDWVLKRLGGLRAVEIGDVVRRRVCPPLAIHGAAAVGRNLARLLEALGPLSSVCPTAAVITGIEPPADDPALLNARLFGVAVGVGSRDSIRVVSQPEAAFRPDVGAYQWHLAELVYAEIAETSVVKR